MTTCNSKRYQVQNLVGHPSANTLRANRKTADTLSRTSTFSLQRVFQMPILYRLNIDQPIGPQHLARHTDGTLNPVSTPPHTRHYGHGPHHAEPTTTFVCHKASDQIICTHHNPDATPLAYVHEKRIVLLHQDRKARATTLLRNRARDEQRSERDT